MQLDAIPELLEIDRSPEFRELMQVVVHPMAMPGGQLMGSA